MAMQPPDPRGEGARSFAHVVMNLGDGDVHSDLSADMHELISAIRDQALSVDGKAKIKGEMSVKFRCECDAKGVVGIEVDSTIKKPKRRRPKFQAWITRGGNLTTEHPTQLKLPVQEVTRRGAATEVADNDRGAREV